MWDFRVLGKHTSIAAAENRVEGDAVYGTVHGHYATSSLPLVCRPGKTQPKLHLIAKHLIASRSATPAQMKMTGTSNNSRKKLIKNRHIVATVPI